MCKEIYPQSIRTAEKSQVHPYPDTFKRVLEVISCLEYHGKGPISVNITTSLNSVTSKIEILAEYAGHFQQTLRVRRTYFLIGLHTPAGYDYMISRIWEEELTDHLM